MSGQITPPRRTSELVVQRMLVPPLGEQDSKIKHLRQIGANVVAACFIIDLPELGGADKLRKMDVPVRTLISFEGH